MVGTFSDFSGQDQLRPPKPAHRPDVPQLFPKGKPRFQDDHVLRPADGHRLGRHFRGCGVGPVKIPHPPQVPRGEAGNIRIGAVQVLRSRHRRALLRPAADQSANFTVRFHMAQIYRRQCVQRCEQRAVVGGYDNIFSIADKCYCWSECCTGRKGFTLPNAACCTEPTQKYACKINLSLWFGGICIVLSVRAICDWHTSFGNG